MPRLVIVLLVVAGLVILFVGMSDAVPLVFFGTEEEREGLSRGRAVMWAAAGVLGVASALLASRGSVRAAVFVAAPAVATLVLVYAFPDSSYAWLAYIPLAPAALAAALLAR